MSKTKIEWTDEVWNPVTGCSKVSAGCENCYAERFAKRFAGWNGYSKYNPFHVSLRWNRLNQPYHWKKPRTIFINSMGDLFHRDVPFSFISKVWKVMLDNNHHTYIILTKRVQRMKTFCKVNKWFNLSDSKIFIGVSIENQITANVRMPIIIQLSKELNYKTCISFEPLLGDIKFNPDWFDSFIPHNIDLAIIGAETGPGRRPCPLSCVKGLIHECVSIEIPWIFIKKLEINGKITGNLEDFPPGFRLRPKFWE